MYLFLLYLISMRAILSCILEYKCYIQDTIHHSRLLIQLQIMYASNYSFAKEYSVSITLWKYNYKFKALPLVVKCIGSLNHTLDDFLMYYDLHLYWWTTTEAKLWRCSWESFLKRLSLRETREPRKGSQRERNDGHSA